MVEFQGLRGPTCCVDKETGAMALVQGGWAAGCGRLGRGLHFEPLLF